MTDVTSRIPHQKRTESTKVTMSPNVMTMQTATNTTSNVRQPLCAKNSDMNPVKSAMAIEANHRTPRLGVFWPSFDRMGVPCFRIRFMAAKLTEPSGLPVALPCGVTIP